MTDNVIHVDFGGNEPLLTRKELSDALGYSARTIEKFDGEGLPSERRGRFTLYKETAARNWDRERKGQHDAQQQGQALRRQAAR